MNAPPSPNIFARDAAELDFNWAAKPEAADVVLVPVVPPDPTDDAPHDTEAAKVHTLLARAQGRRVGIIL